MGRWEIVGAVRLTTSSTLVSFGGASQAGLSGTTISADRSQHGRERSRIIVKVGKCRQGLVVAVSILTHHSPSTVPIVCLLPHCLLPTATANGSLASCQLLPTTPPTTPPKSNSSGNDDEQHWPGPVVSLTSVITRGVTFLHVPSRSFPFGRACSSLVSGKYL